MWQWNCKICSVHPVTVSRNYVETAEDNIAFASTINTGFASFGAITMPTMRR